MATIKTIENNNETPTPVRPKRTFSTLGVAAMEVLAARDKGARSVYACRLSPSVTEPDHSNPTDIHLNKTLAIRAIVQ
jgi:hypothetical protein